MIHIYSIQYNKPEFIELQKRSFDKFIGSYTFTVINNSVDNKTESAIGKMCEKLGLREIQVPNKYDSRKDRLYGISHEVGINCFLKELKTHEGKKDIIMLMDHDVFLVSNISNIGGIIEESSIATVKQRVEHIYYLWPGLSIFNIRSCPNIGEISMNGCEKNGNSWTPIADGIFTDVGGHSYHYLKKYETEVRLLYLREYFVESNDPIETQHVFYHFLAGSQWNGASNEEWSDKFQKIEKIIFSE